MDRIKYLLAITAMSSLFSCSGDDMSDINVDVKPNGNSEFAIQLSGRSSSMSAGSRAAILDNNAGLQGIGVWCVAKNNNDATTGSISGMNWFGIEAGPISCLIKNQKADIEEGTGNVKWVSAEPMPVYYYPITQTYKYEFYANYPYCESDATSESANYLSYKLNGQSVMATYTIDGTTDILWGRASSDEKYAWSARYFRLNGGVTDDNKPNLQMEHMLTRLVFYVTPGDDGSVDDGSGSQYQKACKMTVTSLTIRNATNKVNLVVADSYRPTLATDSRISAFSPVSTADFVLKNADKTDAGSVNVQDCFDASTPDAGAGTSYTITPKQWGESIMLLPAQEYKVYMTMKMTDDSGVERTFETEMPLKLRGEEPFKRGTSYNVTITVYRPTEIEAKATISDWVEEVGPGLEF